MSWTYRVTKQVSHGETVYNIREVYDGNSPTVNPCYPQGETLEELLADMQMMMKAFAKPIYDMEEIC